MSEEKNLSTPAHESRKKAAEASKKRKVVVEEEWVEIVKRVPNEDGKVILKRVTSSGLEHSWYVGRESKCQSYLHEAEKKGIYKPHKERRGR